MKNRIRELRKNRNLTMKELGNIVGLAESTISQYETGKRQPDNEVLLKMGEFFGVTVDYLLGSNFSTNFLNIAPMPKFNQVPLVGEIACGKPILAVEDATTMVDMPEHVHADFALRCKGDSMINARIFDGDIVYIRSQPTVETGEIAAVRIDDEATLKRVRLYEDHICLEAENPMYKPLVYWGNDMNKVQILGKAVAFTSVVI